jgi:neutral trehalase
MNRHAAPHLSTSYWQRAMTPENNRDWIAMVSRAEPAPSEPLEPEDWFRDLLAERAAEDADDRQGDFYDGAPDFD